MNKPTSIAVASAVFVLVSNPALAQDKATVATPAPENSTGGTSDQMTDIVVTAQKRSERINDVGMAITAATGDDLRAKGIVDTSDFSRLEPSFNYTRSSYGAPVYSIRGVGFYDTATGATPAVTVYVDQVPVPYSIMARTATFDLERVEVLKGPQGTLFGQNSTGGAINYIAAKPTSELHTGGDVSFGRFNSLDATMFVSGPLSDTLSARLSLHTEQGSPWQRSYTRNDELGAVNRSYGRLLLNWRPAERLTIDINGNGGYDRSDSQAGQLIAVPFAGLAPAIRNYPLAPADARAADWNPGFDYRHHDWQAQIAGTVSYDLTDDITLKSISSYQHYKLNVYNDVDGTTFSVFQQVSDAYINSFSQELQIIGKTGRLNWIVGGNYGKDKVYDTLQGSFFDSRLGLFGVRGSRTVNTQRVETKAVFANAEYELVDGLKLQGGVRYTDQDRSFNGCQYDDGDGTFAAFVRRQFGANVGPGDCVLLNAQLQPGPYIADLNQDNVSWRGGVNWKVDRHSLLYATVSKGYKAGAFPTAGASFTAGLFPAVQESLLAYEAGFKLGLLNRVVQLNGAVFYYDYKNKQVRGRIVDPTLGSLNRLINIPKSQETGFEVSVEIKPMRGLTLTGAVTYLDSEIKKPFTNLDALGVARELGGYAFPYTPKWTAVGGMGYETRTSGGLRVYGNADLTYRSSSFAGLGEVPQFRINPATLLDLRVGIESPDGRVGVALWGRNVTNTYSWSNVLTVNSDTVIRYASMPVTYGLTLTLRN